MHKLWVWVQLHVIISAICKSVTYLLTPSIINCWEAILLLNCTFGIWHFMLIMIRIWEILYPHMVDLNLRILAMLLQHKLDLQILFYTHTTIMDLLENKANMLMSVWEITKISRCYGRVVKSLTSQFLTIAQNIWWLERFWYLDDILSVLGCCHGMGGGCTDGRWYEWHMT